MSKRTDVDWSNHVLTVSRDSIGTVHSLKMPSTYAGSVKFINTNGVLAVTGDFGNWIFCREFIPGPHEYVSDSYWIEKLHIASSQKPEKFDSEKTIARLEELLLDEELDDDIKEYYKDCLDIVDMGEMWYKTWAYDNMPEGYCYESIVAEDSLDYWLLVIFDAFDEVCRRLKDEQSGA